jgi:hypothetical protein
MSDASLPQEPQAGFGRDDVQSALFANMVLQQSQMALMFLGKVPHPESGQPVTDLDAARMFIDQLEMLEVKTKGNLSKDEEGLLRQTLAAVRFAFVEAVEKVPEAPAPATTASVAEEAPQAGSAPTSSAEESEARTKFSKKY